VAIASSASQFRYNCVILTTAAVVEQAQQYPSLCIHSCSPIPSRKGLLSSVNHDAECQVDWCLEKEVNLTEMVQRSPCTNTQIFTSPNDLCMRAWRTLHTEGLYLYHIQLLHLLKLCTWVCGYNHTVELMQYPKWFVKLCLMLRSVLTTLELTVAEIIIYGTIIFQIEE